MITKEELRVLADFHSQGQPVVSLYANTDLTNKPKEECRLAVRRMLKEAEAPDKDSERIVRFLDFEYDWQSRSLALFSCQARGFWEAIRLPVTVEEGISVGDRPRIQPLVALLDEHESYGVAMVGRERLRLFRVRWGLIEELTGLWAEVPGRHKQGGWAQGRYQRHIDGLAMRNLKQAAELTAAFVRGEGISRLVLGGTEENLSAFQEFLPQETREMVVGTFSLEMAATESQVLERSKETIAKAERAQEAALVERLITTSVKGGGAVLGLDETLAALQEGRVWLLVVDEGFRAPGFACRACQRLVAYEMPKCPLCGGEPQEEEDVVEMAVRKAIATGVQVETVKDSPDLARAGHIGAFLRYAVR